MTTAKKSAGAREFDRLLARHAKDLAMCSETILGRALPGVPLDDEVTQFVSKIIKCAFGSGLMAHATWKSRQKG